MPYIERVYKKEVLDSRRNLRVEVELSKMEKSY